MAGIYLAVPIAAVTLGLSPDAKFRLALWSSIIAAAAWELTTSHRRRSTNWFRSDLIARLSMIAVIGVSQLEFWGVAWILESYITASGEMPWGAWSSTLGKKVVRGV